MHMPPSMHRPLRAGSIRMRSDAGRLAFAGLLLALTGSAQSPATPTPPPLPDHPLIDPVANPEPDIHQAAYMVESADKEKAYAAANLERKRQIDADTATLLKLAADLKAELDKTAQDQLPVKAMREAEEIEILAHSVREKMKLTVGVADLQPPPPLRPRSLADHGGR